MQAPDQRRRPLGRRARAGLRGRRPAGGAGTDLDGEATYRLGFAGDPDPDLGYHVKVTVHTPGSQGADTKSKVFWVSPCDRHTSRTASETGSREPRARRGGRLRKGCTGRPLAHVIRDGKIVRGFRCLAFVHLVPWHARHARATMASGLCRGVT